MGRGGAGARHAAGASHEPLDDAFFDRFPKLEILASCGVGYDHVDAKAAARRGSAGRGPRSRRRQRTAHRAMGA